MNALNNQLLNNCRWNVKMDVRKITENNNEFYCTEAR